MTDIRNTFAANPKNLSKISLNHTNEPTTLLVSQNSEPSNLIEESLNSSASRTTTTTYSTSTEEEELKRAYARTHVRIVQEEEEVWSVIRKKWRLS